MKAGSGVSYIGLDIADKGVYTCTSSGHLRLSTRSAPEGETSSVKASLPMRLLDFHLSPDQTSFSYGGDEVDLSVWDAERAFTSGPVSSTSNSEDPSKKRKKPSANDLLPGEVWRAKNLPNDNLHLRQPVHVASLTFLSSNPTSSSTAGPSHHIVTGNRLGHVRRYDTRAARKPVANWTQFKSVQKVQQGASEHEVLVSDIQSGLYSVDTRTGKILCGYKGISGAINALVTIPSPSQSTPQFASTSLDRYYRLHTAYPPPSDPKQHPSVERRSEVDKTPLKVFLKGTPTALVWDGVLDEGVAGVDDESEDDEEEEDEDWGGMDVVADGQQGSEDESGSDEEQEPRAVRARRS